MLTAIIVLAALAAFFGLILGYASIKFKVEGDPIVEQIDNLLPQTQCGQCGYPGCRPYAEAIANEEAGINMCPPGGEATVMALAELMGVDPEPLDDDGEEKLPEVAFIDEQKCIGCTLCFKACPVDAIVGAAKQMHTILGSECTGCTLCIEPCPVECISMVEVEPSVAQWKWPYPESRIAGGQS